MKKYFIVFLILSIFLIIGRSAIAFELEPRIGYMIYSDSETRAGTSLELRLKQSPAFLSLQKDQVRKYGQDFSIDSIGIGFEYKLWNNFNLWIKGVYYDPNYDPEGFGQEGLYYAQVKYWVPPLSLPTMFSHYILEYSPAFGAEAGVDAKINLFDVYQWNLLKHVDIGVTLAYRYLRINEFIHGVPWQDAWFLEQNRDFGGAFVGGLITIKF